VVFVDCTVQRESKQCPVHFTVVSKYVDRFLQYLAPRRPILRKYATQKLFICPPQLRNAAALPWENNW